MTMIFLLLEKKVVIYLKLVNQKRYRFIIGASMTALSHIYTIQRINVNTLMGRSFVVKVSGSTKFKEKSREGLLDCISV